MRITKPFIILFLSLVSCAVCSAKGSVTEQETCVEIRPEGKAEAQVIRLTPINDDIIRVEATPEENLPQLKPSLIIVKQAKFDGFTVEKTAKEVIVSTNKLMAKVCKSTGQVTFIDKATGKTLLSESAKNGKRFATYVSPQTHLPEGYIPTSKEEINYGKDQDLNVLSPKDRTALSWTLRFQEQPDEALYGLGQHQNEDMNLKGKDEDLYQYNTKVSVPFVMSTKGYGVLWDSYSYCRFGNPYGYEQLQKAFTLYDKNKRKGSLTGIYTDKSGNKMERQEDSVYFENSATIGALPKGFELNGAKVRYEGYIEAKEDMDFRFLAYYAGYVKITIQGEEVMPTRWRTAWNPNTHKFTKHLKKGVLSKIVIEWQPDGAVSYCGLRVAKPISKGEQEGLTIWSEMSREMDYYFMRGDNMDQVIHSYRTLTGKAPVMPLWSMGFWQSRERYKTSDDVVGTLREFRQRGIPVDNIVQDWSYWKEDSWGSHQFDPLRYPDVEAMLDSVHKMNGRFMISVWPKFYASTQNFQALDANGWMYQQAVNDSIRDWIGPGYIGSFYDAYSKGARRLFWQQMNGTLYKPFHNKIDAWWMDASEPNVRDCTPIEYRKLLCGPTALGTSDEYFNAYALLNAEAIYNGQRKAEPNKRVFLLTRSGFAGLQRYSTATWSGDIASRWEDLRAQLSAGINFSMSGVPFWGMDIGGFTPEDRYVKAQTLYNQTKQENSDLKEWRELQVRWHQAGLFVPLYRTHGQWPEREVWNIAPEGSPEYNAILDCHRLRYRLLPYIYSLCGDVHLRDYTMLRGLAMDFPEDKNVWDISDEWMFGPSLLACPVTKYKARERKVYLPKGSTVWYDFFTHKAYQGGATVSKKAGLDEIPVFAPQGSIVPMGVALQYSTEKKQEEITLLVFQGKDADFTLYEDDGETYNYEQGKYTQIPIHWSEKEQSLTIGERKGGFPEMLKSRTFHVKAISSKGEKTADIAYNGASVVRKLQ